MYGNTTFSPFTVEVYAPIPEIRTITSTGMLFGRIDEPIKDEPIHLFRIREGTPLTLVSQDSMMTKDDGVFSTGSLFVNDAILLSYS